jgi:galactose mutarotase-like enzyme
MEYKLRNKNFTAVCLSQGGELVSMLSEKGVEYLWKGDATSWSGHSPNLFPIVGALKDAKHEVDGKIYNLRKHGFAQYNDFRIVEQGDAFIVFELNATEETRKEYPFEFKFQIRHELIADGALTTYHVVNTGDDPLPFCIGAHPGLACPLFPGEQFSDYELAFGKPVTLYALRCPDLNPIDPDDIRCLFKDSATLGLDYSLFDYDVLIFRDVSCRDLSIRHKKEKHGIRMLFDDFPAIGLWTAPHKAAPYLCLEPWQGIPAVKGEGSAIKDKAYAIVLQPGGERFFSYSLHILEAVHD